MSADKVLQHRESGIALKSQAVLFRTSHHSAALEIELARRNIPFVKFGGLKFLEAAHVKDVLAFLRWAENLRDRMAGFRVIQLMPGAGPATAGRLLDCVAETGDSACRARSASSRRPPPPSTGRHSAKRSGWCAADPRDGRPSSISSAAGTRPHLERIYDDAEMRKADLAQLAQIASTYASRERFLTELTLDPPDATSAEAGVPLLDEDYLILSTIHSAKGQEWTSVFVLNAVDGCIPSDLATGSTRRDRGGAPSALCGDDARQGSSASDRAAALLSRISSAPAATATCTPPARASFRPKSSTASRAARGRSPPAQTWRQRPPSALPSTSARACAGCGADRAQITDRR